MNCLKFDMELIYIYSGLLSGEKNHTMYIELGHGGHLGFYEGGLVYPNPVTWLDRALVAIVGGIVLSHHDRGLKSGV